MDNQAFCPSALLLCHENERFDREGLAAWLATEFRLVGVVVIRNTAARRRRAIQREWRRSGTLGLLDVLAFRLWHRLVHARNDDRWTAQQIERLETCRPPSVDQPPTLYVTDPNDCETAAFITRLQPDVVIARCKLLLKPSIFTIPRAGTFVMHPGICPEYRNAHGCFWALARRDVDRVGMTLLRIDAGIDTGPIYFQGGYAYDETRESHIVIQQRSVIENLPAIARILKAACAGTARPLPVVGRVSAVWGQPRLSAYFRWKWAARRRRDASHRIAAVS